MNWQDVATALWLAETDQEREQADRMYRAQMRVTLYGPQPGHELAGLMEAGAHGTLVARASGPIDPGQAVAYVAPVKLRPHQQPPASDGPTEGQIRSSADGSGVEQYRQGIWQDVDPVDLFKHQRAVIDAQRGDPIPEPPVDPALLPPVVAPVPDAETAYRHQVVLQQRRAGHPAATPAEPPEPSQGPVGGVDTLAGGHAAGTLSAGDVNVQPEVCGQATPDGPCGLKPGHPVGGAFPGYGGHMHTGD